LTTPGAVPILRLMAPRSGLPAPWRRLLRAAAGVTLAMLAVTTCGCRAAVRDEPHLDTRLRAAIELLGLTGDPHRGLDLPRIDESLAQLGKKLFFTKALSGDMDTACVSCHHPLLGGGDGLSVSIGVGAVEPDLLGPGRRHVTGLPNVARNAPTVFNVGLWRRALFHDQRLHVLPADGATVAGGALGIRTPDVLPGLPDPLAGPDLVAAQSRFPIVSPAEMRGFTYAAHQPHRVTRAYLAARLGDYGPGRGELRQPGWAREFARVFGADQPVEALVSDQNVALALSAYQRSQVLVASPWRDYVNGDDAVLSEAAKRGALLFLTPVADGGAGCVGCHVGDAFTDERAHVLAVPQVGPGRHDDPYTDPTASVADDLGCWHATFRHEDRYAFRTPSLLNVEVTGPYGHNGAYVTLEGIVRHHLGPAAAVAAYDVAQLEPAVQTARLAESAERALAKLAEDRVRGRTPLVDVALADGQVRDLVAFLHALTDPCVKDPACLQPWLPGPEDADPDGMRLAARFAAGKVEP
jgi:cytochrome c peroxidase